MHSRAIIFGAIGSLAETSEVQRQSFNAAFKDFGLDWDWSAENYKSLLQTNGGRNRISHYANQVGADLSDDDIVKLHQSKTDNYEDHVRSHGLSPRPGVTKILKSAKEQAIKTGFASTTSQQNIDALFGAFGEELPRELFDFILSGEDVSKPKPDPEIYELAISRLGVPKANIVVIEDTPVSASSAVKAGVHVVATPGKMFEGAQFHLECKLIRSLGDMTIERLFQLM